MLKAVEMSKVRILGPKSLLRHVVKRLHELQLVHLITYEKKDADFFDIGIPFEEATAYSETLIKIRAMLDYFNVKHAGKSIQPEKHLKTVNSLYDAFQRALATEKSANDKIQTIETKREEAIFELGLNQKVLTEYKHLDLFIGSIQKSINRRSVDAITQEYELIEKNTGKKKLVALFAAKGHKEQLQAMLREHEFNEIKNVNLDTREIEHALKESKRSLADAERKLQEIEKQSTLFVDLEHTLSQEVEQAEAPLRFATTKNAFVVRGWIPSKKLSDFKKSLNETAKEKIHIEEFEDTEEAPVKLNNPKKLSPFEFFLDLYTLPKYYEIDPTILMAFTFPFFFGFMLGDVGYGIVAGLLFYMVKRKFKGNQQVEALTSVLLTAAVASILFGFIYGEAFGVEFLEHPLLNRVHDINTVLMISIIVGIVHINLGFILGFYNKLKHGGFMHALLEKGSWILLEIGVAIAVLANQLIGGAIALAAVAMLYKGEGFRGLIELPALLSNILSYARLFALGLASVQLALIINSMAGQMWGAGILGMVGAIVIVLIGHTINIFLGILGPFIQSLRLHYVEFFSKFYEGGGDRYSPFGGKK